MSKSKTEVINAFKDVTNELLALLNSKGETQLNLKPFEGSWSVAQVGEHLYKSYAFVEILNGHTKSTERPPDEKVAMGKALFENFELKYKSSESISPSITPIEKEKLTSGLKKIIAQIIETVEKKDILLICTDFAISQYGEFTGLEWVWFNIYHTRRHVQQIKNIYSTLNSKK
jgi:hypothetical protein